MRRTLLVMGLLLLATPNCSQQSKSGWHEMWSGCSHQGGYYAGTGEAQSALTGSGGFGAGSGTVDDEEAAAPLYAPCEDASDCESGLCELGYCTMTCVTVHDCEPDVAECVPFGDGNICMPACDSDADCAAYGCSGNDCSACASFAAVDEIGVTVCADQVDPVE